jgi:putative ABC transport system permease protein
MRALATAKIAGRALRRNPMRSALTTLGIIVGVGAVIAMVGIGNGAKAQVESQIASLGRNVILVFSGSTTASGLHTGMGSAGTLTVEDVDAIGREIDGVAGISPEVRTVTQVVAGNQNWATQVLGESPDYFEIRGWALADGAPFTDRDVRSANKVAVIGRTTARQLYGGDSPIGRIVRIKNVPFVIVGLLTPRGLSVMGSDQDDVLIIPYSAAMKRVMGTTTLRSINIQAASGSLLASMPRQITELLRQRHRIGPGRDDDFTVRTQEDIAEAATETSRVMTTLLGAIASVSLIVGGIGIMNIMLVSVTERTREIGIRMAVGPTRHPRAVPAGGDRAELAGRRHRHRARDRHGKGTVGGSQLADVDLCRVDRGGVSVQRGGGRLFRILPRAQGFSAGPYHGLTL